MEQETGNLPTAKDIEDFLTVFRETPEKISMATDELKYLEAKQQDILHELELLDLSYHDRARLAKELMIIRQKRRAMKDQIELLTPLGLWIGQQKPAIDSLKRVLGDMRKVEASHTNRLYFYRADNIGQTIGG